MTRIRTAFTIWLSLTVAGLGFGQALPPGGPVGYTGFYYNTSTGMTEVFTIPSWARIESFLVDAGPTTSVLQVTMEDTIPFETSDRFTVEAYLDSQVAIVWTHGTFSVPSSPPVTSGQAAIVRLADRVVLGSVSVSIVGDTVSFEYATSLTGGGNYDYVASRYLPASVNLDYVAGGLGACVASSHLFLEPNEVPGHYMVSTALYVTQNRIPIGLPTGRQYHCPPAGPNAGTIPKPGDANGDGHNDWDYPGDTPVPGTNKIVGIFGFDVPPPGATAVQRQDGTWYYPDLYGIGIGNDDNGNGRLDYNEVDAWVGRCPFDGGRNTWWLEKHDGVWYMHCISRHPTDGRVRHYIYNTETGILKVYAEGGGLVYQGPPSEYEYFYPAPYSGGGQ